MAETFDERANGELIREINDASIRASACSSHAEGEDSGICKLLPVVHGGVPRYYAKERRPISLGFVHESQRTSSIFIAPAAKQRKLH